MNIESALSKFELCFVLLSCTDVSKCFVVVVCFDDSEINFISLDAEAVESLPTRHPHTTKVLFLQFNIKASSRLSIFLLYSNFM